MSSQKTNQNAETIIAGLRGCHGANTPVDGKLKSEGNELEDLSRLKKLRENAIGRLEALGIIPTTVNGSRSYNVGKSDYSTHLIQPWSIWIEYNLNPWDADIVKRVLRNKPKERRLDYEKIIHICQERIRQIDEVEEYVDPYG